MNIEYVGKCLLIENLKEYSKILVIGDLHLGYENFLNRSGVYVTHQLYKELLLDLELVFKKVKRVDLVVLLGDVKHDHGRINPQEWKDVIDLLTILKEKSNGVVIIQGNHDHIIAPLAKKANVQVEDILVIGEVAFVHGDRDFEELHEKSVKIWVLGHGHPAVKLGDGVKLEKYKCFLEGEYKKKKVVILPSFSNHSEGSDPRENELKFPWKFKLDSFTVRIVGEKLQVLDFGKLGKMK